MAFCHRSIQGRSPLIRNTLRVARALRNAHVFFRESSFPRRSDCLPKQQSSLPRQRSQLFLYCSSLYPVLVRGFPHRMGSRAY